MMWLKRWQARPTVGRVDDRHHLEEVVQQQAVEQGLVPVLELAEVDVPLDIRIFIFVGCIGALRLGRDRFNRRRQQAVQTEDLALIIRKGAAFVEKRLVDQFEIPQRDLFGRYAHVTAPWTFVLAASEVPSA